MLGINSGWNAYANAALYTRYAAAYNRTNAAAVTPVEPVAKTSAASRGQTANVTRIPAALGESSSAIPFLREGADPVEMAVRSRIQYLDEGDRAALNDAAARETAELMGLTSGKAEEEAGTPANTVSALMGGEADKASMIPGAEDEKAASVLPGAEDEKAPGVMGSDADTKVPGVPGGDEDTKIPGVPGAEEEDGETPGIDDKDGEKSKSAQEVMEESECQTCKNRKYQDGSDDPGVSYKTPTKISADNAAAAVRGHEQEHVVRERAEAEREDRKVVSQSVTLHTEICPECGDVYVSGGTTRTVTKANPEPVQETEASGNEGED